MVLALLIYYVLELEASVQKTVIIFERTTLLTKYSTLSAKEKPVIIFCKNSLFKPFRFFSRHKFIVERA